MSIATEGIAPAGERAPFHRLLGLDVLRAFAVLLVLLHHGVIEMGDGGLFRGAQLKLRWFGWVGVDLFFVLSGFLIGGLLFAEIRRTGTLDIPRFLTRRAFKIWPAYFVFIFTGMVLEAHATGWGGSFRIFWPNLFHLQNYIALPEYSRQTWSLAVEEHFYLILPLVLLLFLRRNRSSRMVSAAFLGFLFGTMALVLVLRFVNEIRAPYTFGTHFTPTHLRFDSLLFGVAIAYLRSAHPRHFNRIASHPWLLLGLFAAIMTPLSRYARGDFFMDTAGLTLVYVACGAALIAFAGCEGRPGLLWTLVKSVPGRALATIGTWSYSIYLWQFFGHEWAVRISLAHFTHLSATLRFAAATALYLAFAISLGVVMNKLVEAPMLALRDRVMRGRSTVRSQAPNLLSVSVLPQPEA